MNDISSVYYAVLELRRLADRALWRAATSDQCDAARSLERVASEAEAAFPKVREMYHKGVEADKHQRRAYDAYVTAPQEGCSCHINPPCSYCIGGGTE